MVKISQCYITRLTNVSCFTFAPLQKTISIVALISFDHHHNIKKTNKRWCGLFLYLHCLNYLNYLFMWPKAVRRRKDEGAEESSPLQVFHGERRGPPLYPREPRGTRPPGTPSAALSATCSFCCSSMGWLWSHLQKCEPPWIQTYGHNITVNVNNRWVDSMATKFTETPVAS